MSKYRNKEALEVGSGDEVTETLLEITPLARQTFDSVVNVDDLRDAVLEDYDERQAAKAQSQVNEAPVPNHRCNSINRNKTDRDRYVSLLIDLVSG